MNSTTTPAIFLADSDRFVATGLSRGPWDENAQHGGAPAALLTHVAERATDHAFFLARLTFELTRPVPIAPLTVAATASSGRTVRRVDLRLDSEGRAIGRATALMLRERLTAVPEAVEARLTPAPEQCRERFATPGMPTTETFHRDALDILTARGSSLEPGPAAAWFRLRVPVVEGVQTTPAMRAAAAADFGNGLSWILPFDEYLYTNTDLTFYLHRAPVGEWIGLDCETLAEPNGVGLTNATLYDTSGRIGVAHQNLLIRPR